jgi:XTP/dITP diphosphohydrolase
MNILLASNNQHKLQEIRKLIDPRINLNTLENLDYKNEIPETIGTIEGNAIQKAKFVYDETGLNCFSDDSGLEILSLNNKPGVDSAHYAGKERNHQKNIAKVLQEMEGENERSARFVTVIALCVKGEIVIFEGEVKGQIVRKQKGIGGFGYDPIFQPMGSDLTFAEMSLEIKNLFSHRANAIKKLNNWFQNNIL